MARILNVSFRYYQEQTVNPKIRLDDVKMRHIEKKPNIVIS